MIVMLYPKNAFEILYWQSLYFEEYFFNIIYVRKLSHKYITATGDTLILWDFAPVAPISIFEVLYLYFFVFCMNSRSMTGKTFSSYYNCCLSYCYSIRIEHIKSSNHISLKGKQQHQQRIQISRYCYATKIKCNVIHVYMGEKRCLQLSERVDCDNIFYWCNKIQ